MNEKQPSHKKLTYVLFAVLMTAAISGYFMGLQQTASSLRASHEDHPADREVDFAGESPPRAVEYTRVAEKPRPNTGWRSDLRQLNPEEFDGPFEAPVQAVRLEALSVRSERRAFDGAPPVVPHPIEAISSDNCLSCHREGKRVKDKVAPKISHAPYSNCIQCHVPAEGGLNWDHIRLAGAFWGASGFEGLPAIEQGTRAFQGAPPTIPHPTAMRTDCRSCHGPQGLPGLRTSHPDRQNCQQCHAPSAEMDQRTVLGQFPVPRGDAPLIPLDGGGE